jgi:hypothetical protein
MLMNRFPSACEYKGGLDRPGRPRFGLLRQLAAPDVPTRRSLLTDALAEPNMAPLPAGASRDAGAAALRARLDVGNRSAVSRDSTSGGQHAGLLLGELLLGEQPRLAKLIQLGELSVQVVDGDLAPHRRRRLRLPRRRHGRRLLAGGHPAGHRSRGAGDNRGTGHGPQQTWSAPSPTQRASHASAPSSERRSAVSARSTGTRS